MGIYVQQQLEYGKLWKLVEFSQVSAPSCSCSTSTVLSIAIKESSLQGNKCCMRA